jgi:hypothetical protein
MLRSSAVKILLMSFACMMSNVAEADRSPPYQPMGETLQELSSNSYKITTKVLAVLKIAVPITIETTDETPTTSTGTPTNATSFSIAISSAVGD